VSADGKGLVGHAGAVLLRRLADRVGLTDALAGVLPSGTTSSWRDRATALVGLGVAIALGATNLLEAEQLQLHHGPLFGGAVSDSTLHRLLSTTDGTRRAQIAKVRQRVRRHVWTLLHLRPGGFPYLTVAGRHLRGWIVLDMDATVITAASRKQGAAGTFKGTFGFHPLAAWLANTDECLAMELREGNAGCSRSSSRRRSLTRSASQGDSDRKNCSRCTPGVPAPATGSAPARQVIVLFRSRGASSPVRYSRKPRRWAGLKKRSSNWAA
jgi:hypothetical protein